MLADLKTRLADLERGAGGRGARRLDGLTEERPGAVHAAVALDAQARHGAESAAAHLDGHAVGDRPGLPERRSGRRRGHGGAAETPRPGGASAGDSARRGRRRAGRGSELRRVGRAEAGVRVPGADGHAVDRGPAVHVGRDRPCGADVDGSGGADEGEARASGAAVRPGGRGPSGGEAASRSLESGREGRAGVPELPRQGDRRRGHLEAGSAIWASRRCRTGSGRRSGTGRRSERTTLGKSWRRRWRTR